MSTTKIEWADMTINPIVGCSKCSPGCDNCYAERFAARLAKNPRTATKYAGVVDDVGKWTGRIRNAISNADGSTNYTGTSPWQFFRNLGNKPKRVFVGSMTDVFHKNTHEHDIAHIMHGIHDHPRHTFTFLTKRPERMREIISRPGYLLDGQPLPNLWLGVTVCNQAEADEKIPILLQTPAAKRFVSVEPMLGAVDLTHFLEAEERIYRGDAISGFLDYEPLLHWVICGGETGPNARPMHPDWVRSLRDQCQDAAVPFFFKGWGEWQPTLDGNFCWKSRRLYLHPDGNDVTGIENGWNANIANLQRVGKKRAGRLLDGQEWNEVPE